MVDWEAARAFTEDACAATFDTKTGRLIGRRPGATVNHSEQDDPARAPFDFMCSVDLEPTSDIIRRYPSADPQSGNGVISYDAVITAHVGSWPWSPRMGDHIVIGDKTWRVEASRKDGSNRPAWFVSEVRNVGG
ncbi:hypothetical protein [Agrobacterium sp. ST15.13.015]|uniref:hypothetical protein n=1 Tax=Agrobacterium sp. ST15.13.015 TaxID=3017319 RepID=UPI0022C3141A|nr:hypothetical protein [Agrobacterium sp. ST15.13.015]MCZ7501257.1 hypothetical protein [Rhizobium rhizogenes]